MKLYPVLLEFKERISMLCHLYRRKKNIGKCLSTKGYHSRGWGGGSVSEGACLPLKCEDPFYPSQPHKNLGILVANAWNLSSGKPPGFPDQ